MSGKSNIVWPGAVVLALLGLAVFLSPGGGEKAVPAEATPDPNNTPPPELAVVERIIDGDEILLETGQKVRYVGIRVPSVAAEVQCFGPEAVAANSSVIGKQVRLEREPLLDRGRDGSWMRYVYLIQGEVDPEEDPKAESTNTKQSPEPSDQIPNSDETEEIINDKLPISNLKLDADEGVSEETGEEDPAGEEPEEGKDPEDIFINNRILEGGFGFPVLVEEMKYRDMFESSARFARATSKGLWGQCEPEANSSGQYMSPVVEDCVIKGVGTASGKFYRTQECSSWKDTVVLPSEGGKYFCSEDEAELSGYKVGPEC